MSIRVKLLLLIAILVVAFGAAASAYFALRSQAREIRSELETLTALRSALVDEGYQANRLASGELERRLASLSRAVHTSDGAFRLVKALRILPRLSALTASSLVSVEELQRLLDGETGMLVEAATELRQDAKRFYGNRPSQGYSLYRLLIDERRSESPSGEATLQDAESLLNDVVTVSGDLDAATSVIDSQFSTISIEIGRVEARGSLIAFALILFLIAGTILLALLLAGRIARSVRSIARDIARMREGDLTRRFTVATRDEIAALSENLNEFVRDLRGSMQAVQEASAENVRMKEGLIATTAQASASATQITASTESIGRRVSTLDASLLSSSNAMNSIAEAIRLLNQQIGDQAAMVEESTTSVTQIIASIDNVTRTAETRREASQRLVSTVFRGGDKMRGAFAAVNQIHQSVGSIKEITSVIEELSAQTNLLAMNAAIEAAHAGDAGRGFSVVADEIRKLAEASSANSRKIAAILKSIVGRIVDATSAGEEMEGAFVEIDQEAKELSASLGEISASMEEIRSGGGQVLRAMSSLQEASTRVKEGSDTIRESSTEIGSSMTLAQQVSTEVRGGMGEIAHGIREISTAVMEVLTTASRLGELSESLNHDLARFKTA